MALSSGNAKFSLLFLTVLLGSGIGLILSSVRFRLTLTFNAITFYSAFKTQSVLRIDISDYMIRGIPYGRSDCVLYLFISGRRLPVLSIRFDFKDNIEILTWFDGIPERKPPTTGGLLFR